MVLSYAWPRWSSPHLSPSSLIPLDRQELLDLGLDVSLSESGYRQLVVTWDSTLVVCSFVVSFLGAYSASQVCCQANVSSKKHWSFYAWNGLAAVLFGLCSVWSLHFLAMLAAQFPVDVSLSPGTTAFSAFIAVLFTWLALVSDSFASRFLRKQRTKSSRNHGRRGRQRLSNGTTAAIGTNRALSPRDDVEAQPLLDADETISDLESPAHTSSSHRSRSRRTQNVAGPGDSRNLSSPDQTRIHTENIAANDDGAASPVEAPVTELKRNLNEASYLMAVAMEDASVPLLISGNLAPSLQRIMDEEYTSRLVSHNNDVHGSPQLRPNDINTPFAARLQNSQHGIMMSRENSVVEGVASDRPEPAPIPTRSRRFSFPFFPRKRSSGSSPLQNDAARASSTDVTSSDGNITPRLSSTSSPFGESSGLHDTYSSISSSNTSIAKHLPLTRRERLRLKAGGAISHVSLRELLLTLWGDCDREACAKAFMWSSAVVAMHYSGMAAFHVAEGFAIWNIWLLALSCVIAFIVCLVGTLFMPNMEVHIGRQLAFSVIAAAGVFAMHMTGMSAATFLSTAPPAVTPGYPAMLSVTIVAFAILTCIASTTVVSHAATLSRNKLVEMIHVKQQLWRTLAQKEAVEQTVALQAEFTSVAAHELRTPLHTVTGYIDLLSRTQLDEEQALYVETVRRACRTIQNITTNVLDFTRLERANDEGQARPVAIALRSFLVDLAGIIEDKSPRLDTEADGLEFIIDVHPDVPDAVYLDETYLTRIVMNLVNNAIKFCPSGFIDISANIHNDTLTLAVQDTGIGIPHRFLERIFEPFRQADTSLTRLNNGSGLGLAICKRLVSRLDGELTVSSVEGEGSVFTMTLNKPTMSGNAVDNEALREAFVSKKIMIFCPNRKTLDKLEQAWRQPGCEILPTSAALQELYKANYVWADLPTIFKGQSELLAFMKDHKNDPDTPHFLIPYSLETELLPLPASDRIIPIKRPIAFHTIFELLQRPASDIPTTAGKDKPKLVRFASLQSSVYSENTDSTPATSVADTAGPIQALPTLSGKQQQHLTPKLEATAQMQSKKTILIAEDNLVNVKLGQRMLCTLGYDVLVSYNGLEALEAVKMAHDSIFLILMDCQMPVMSGEESTAAIRQYESEHALERRIPILALSANVTSASSNKILDQGADLFLSKPITLAGLQEAIMKYEVGVE